MLSRDMRAGLPIVSFESAAAWEDWLSRQPPQSSGLWLKLAKKESGIPSVSRQEAIDGALCHGWIDGQLQKFDEHYWLIRFTPRKARSKWSQINQTRATELIENGRMCEAGRAEVERAKADRRWEVAYTPQSKSAVPDDLQEVLGRSPAASELFARLDSLNRYAILYRLQDAKRAETRVNRIAKFVQMLARGETIYPLKSKKS